MAEQTKIWYLRNFNLFNGINTASMEQMNKMSRMKEKRKKEIMDMVPQGGYWKDLPIEVQKEYMKGSFYLGGGKTGTARRLSMKEPSLTLVTSPAQGQTERCHPLETRPLTIRESA